MTAIAITARDRAASLLSQSGIDDYGDGLLGWAESVVEVCDEAISNADSEEHCWDEFHQRLADLPEHTEHASELVNESAALRSRASGPEGVEQVLTNLAHDIARLEGLLVESGEPLTTSEPA